MRTPDDDDQTGGAAPAAHGAPPHRAGRPAPSALRALASNVRLGLTAAAIVAGLATGIPWLVDRVWR